MTDLNTMFNLNPTEDEQLHIFSNELKFRMESYGYRYGPAGNHEPPINMDNHYVDLLMSVVTELLGPSATIDIRDEDHGTT